MKIGTNKLTIYASDIAGNPVANISGGWQVVGQIDDTVIDSAIITPSISGEGYYIAEVELPTKGQGFLEITNSDDSIQVTPTYFDLDTTAYDTDDVYTKFLQSTSIPLVTNSSLNQTSITSVVNDDIVIDISIGSGIVSSPFNDGTLTDLDLSCYGASYTAPTSGYSTIPADITVLSEANRTIRFEVARSDLSYDKLSEGLYYFDVEAINSSNKKRTIHRVKVQLIRDFAPN